MPPPFLRLDQLLLPPPLAALSGLLQACGIAGLGVAAARRLRGSRFEVLDGAAGVVLVAALLGSAVHGLALLGQLRLGLLRGLAASLAVAGVGTAIHCAPLLLRQFRLLRDRWRQWPILDRLLAILIAATAVGLFLAALAPATDTDSVGYHLGVPLEWLRHGGAEARPDWFVVRLIGVGDLLDLLGLAGGSDSFGAVLQWSGAILAAMAVAAFAHRERDRLIAVAMVVSAPVLLSLVPAQKAQVFPAAATAVALVLIVRRWNAIDRSTLALTFTGAAFAMSCKYSFLFSGWVVVIAGLVAARRAFPGFSVAAALVAVLLIAAPVYGRNFAFYGDPVSPFLERWRIAPNPSLLDFAAFYRNHGQSRDALGMLWLIVITFAGWPLSGALGIGVLSWLLGGWRKASGRRLLLAAGAVATLDLIFGELTPRFFLEPFFWSIAALGLRERPLGIGWVALASAQAAVTAVGAATCAFIVFPGSWSSGFRDRVLSAHAFGYAESRWLDEILRPEDVILTQNPSAVFLPRPFVMADTFDGLHPEALEQQELRTLELDAGVTVLTVEFDELSPTLQQASETGQPVDKAQHFPAGTRNPLRHTPDVDVRVFRLDPTVLRP